MAPADSPLELAPAPLRGNIPHLHLNGTPLLHILAIVLTANLECALAILITEQVLILIFTSYSYHGSWLTYNSIH